MTYAAVHRSLDLARLVAAGEHPASVPLVRPLSTGPLIATPDFEVLSVEVKTLGRPYIQALNAQLERHTLALTAPEVATPS